MTSAAAHPGFCRDCLADATSAPRCKACGSPRLMRHPEIGSLAVAHVDCDAFYATIEKRDDPSLSDKSLIIGGGKRGVVSTACYVARTFGIHSAMPMFKARALCPHATVISPNMQKYVGVGREVRRLMFELTPQVEPLSIDEAFMDLTGTERLHGMTPARSLARFAQRVEADIGITVSIGLSANKFLAKIASAWKKPDGLTVIPPERVEHFLQKLPVDALWGVGPVTAGRLRERGIERLIDVRAADEAALRDAVGSQTEWLRQLAAGIDDRPVVPNRAAKSCGNENTFSQDLTDLGEIRDTIDEMARDDAAWLERKALVCRTVTIKVRYSDFTTITRSHSQLPATRNPDLLAARARALLDRTEAGQRPIRLLGVSVHNLLDPNEPSVATALPFVEDV